MNRLKLSFIAAAMLLVVGCGGGGSSDNSEATKVETVEEAKSSFQSLSALTSMDGFSTQISSNKLQKTSSSAKQSASCDNGGTVSIDIVGATTSIVANQCQYGNYYMDGSINMTELSDGSEKFIMSNMTMKDGAIDMYVSQMVFVDNEAEHWSTMDGDIKIVSKCFSGKYDFKTIEKMYEAQDGSNNVETGVVELNGARYTFSNPYVTIKVGGKESEPMLQSELEKKMNNTLTCSE